MKPRDEQGRWTKLHYVVRSERVDVDQDTQVPVDVLLADASPTLSRRRERAQEAAKAAALEKLRRLRPPIVDADDDACDDEPLLLACNVCTSGPFGPLYDDGDRCPYDCGDGHAGAAVCLDGAPQ